MTGLVIGYWLQLKAVSRDEKAHTHWRMNQLIIIILLIISWGIIICQWCPLTCELKLALVTHEHSKSEDINGIISNCVRISSALLNLFQMGFLWVFGFIVYIMWQVLLMASVFWKTLHHSGSHACAFKHTSPEKETQLHRELSPLCQRRWEGYLKLQWGPF